MGKLRKNLHRSLFFSLFSLILTLQIGAQAYTPFVRNFSPQDYGRKLPTANYAIIQDNRGFIYSATTGAVLEFDGQNWKSILIRPGIYISALCIDTNTNIIYLGGAGELGRLVPGKNGEWKYESFLEQVPEAGLILRCHVLGKKVIFQSENAIHVYQEGSFTTITPEDSYHLSYVCDGKLFVRERGKGLMTLGEKSTELFSDDTLLVNNGIFGMASHDENHWILAIRERGIYLMNKQNKILFPFARTLSPVYMDFNDLVKTNHSIYRYIVPTSGQGILFLDKNAKPVNRITRAGGLQSDEIRDALVDKKGNIWGVSPSGIHFIRINNPFEWFTAKHGLEGEVESVMITNGQLIVGTSSGIYQSTNDSRMLFRNPEWIKGHVYETRNFQKKNGEFFNIVSSSAGLYIIQGNDVRKISNDIFNAASYDPDKNIILAIGRNGVSSFSGSNFSLLDFIGFSVTRALRIERNHLLSNSHTSVFFIGLVEQGVLKVLLGQDGTFELTQYDSNDGLSSGMVRPFNYRDETIFATDNGFQYFVSEEVIREGLPDSLKGDPDFERGMFDVYTLFGRNWNYPISGMAVKPDGSVFLVVDNTVWKIDSKGNIDSTLFRSIDPGMINNLLLVHGDEQLLICGSNGMFRYTESLQPQSSVLPQVAIRSVTSHDDLFSFAGNFGDSSRCLEQQDVFPEIAYSSNSLTFEFSSPTYDELLPVKFAWQLEGYDKNWTDWTNLKTVSYTNLHEGEYMFKVKTMLPDGTISEENTFKFSILPPWYRTIGAYILYFVVFVLLIYISIRIASYRLKQKNIQLEKVVTERTAEIAQKNTVLEHQNEQILHQKKEITDSITYAKRIQEAILPVREEIRKNFPESFVLFKPKDIVSGDFFWFYHSNNTSMIVCADCTGHGVPGAFMSMICTDKLNHAVHEKAILQPGAMLSEVNRGIKRSLRQEGDSGDTTRDGMDAAICAYDHSTGILTYSGANRPLWLLRNGVIDELKPTKCAVGGFTSEDQVYEETTLSIQPGDRIYMSSDGYADQFGGEKGKKMMVKTFKEHLLSLAGKSAAEQENELDSFFEKWKSHLDENGQPYEQIDDVCVIGLFF